MKPWHILLAFLIFATLIACSKEEANILPGKWKLIRIETTAGDLIQSKESSDRKGDVILELAEAFPTAFTGKAVCNEFEGAFEALGGQEIKVKRFFATQIYCPSWGPAFEDRIYKVTSYEIPKRKYLYLLLDEERMVFKKVN